MNGYDILAPGNITRVMQETQSVITLPQPLVWYNRAAKLNVSDDEMTLKEKSYIYAADIISTDSEATVRDSGEFTFERHGSNKIKHGFAINEKMIKLLERIQQNKALDNEVLSLKSYVSRRQAELVIGVQQRVESMINGMFCDDYQYNRFGIKVNASWEIPSDLKFTPATLWDSPSSATPLKDLVGMLYYARREYNEQYNRITGTHSIVEAIIATDEYKNIYKAERAGWNWDNAHINAMNASPLSAVPFLSAYISARVGWQVTFEIDEGYYREFHPSSIQTPGRFHPENKLYFTSTNDDGSSSGWDVANGALAEVLVGGLGSGVIGGTLSGLNPYGPIGYATLSNAQLNPPGLTIWCTAWMSPRRHRDTCSAVATVL